MTAGKLENSVLHEVLREFGQGKNFRIWRNNTGAAYRGTRLIEFGLEGSPDVIGILDAPKRCPHCNGVLSDGGEFIGIETKRESGGKRGAQQLAFHAMAEKLGARVAFVSNLAEARVAMHNWGAVW